MIRQWIISRIRDRTIQSYIQRSSKANPQVFNKDDYIYLLKESLRDKFDEQYKGFYKILETLEILENNNVKLAISDKRTRIVYSNKLKVYKTWPIELL